MKSATQTYLGLLIGWAVINAVVVAVVLGVSA